MKPERPAHPGRDADLREQGLQVAMRLVATLRTGRSYAIGNQVFTRQLEQLLEALAPVLEAHPAAVLVAIDGDLHLNDVRLPLRSTSLKFLEQLAQELQVREIGGVEFRRGVDVRELEDFMRYFLPSELYKAGELWQACSRQGLRHVMPIEAVEPEEAPHGAPEAEAADEDVPHAYLRALQAAQLLVGDATWSHGLELRHLKRVSQPLVDHAYADDAGAGLLGYAPHGGDAPWTHAVHVCVLAVAIGRRLGLDRAALSELGVAALLHDAGKAAVGERVPHAPGARGPAERAEAESHAIEGLRHVARATTLNATSLAVMRAALEHHAGEGGYPPLSTRWQPSPVSQVVSIADAWVSLVEHREDGRNVLTPSEALGRVLGPLAPRFHPALRTALVRALGVYPPGQVVELDDGTLARTHGCDAEDPERPSIERLTGPGGSGEPPAGAAPVTLPPERSVRRALPYPEWPERAFAA